MSCLRSVFNRLQHLRFLIHRTRRLFRDLRPEIIDDPVCHGFGIFGLLCDRLQNNFPARTSFLKTSASRRGQLIIAHESLLARERQFDDARLHFRQPCIRRRERHQIRIGKIAVIVRVFLRAHFLGYARDVVPAARGLDKLSAALHDCRSGAGFRIPTRGAHRKSCSCF